MVVITTNPGVYLLNEKKKIIYYPWKKWEKLQKSIPKEDFCVWGDDIIKKINKVNFKIRKRRKIKKEPTITRTPMKKIKRTPMKKKVKRTPIKRGDK